MRGVEEADEIPDRKKRGVAQTGACGMMQSVKRNVVVDYTEHFFLFERGKRGRKGGRAEKWF